MGPKGLELEEALVVHDVLRLIEHELCIRYILQIPVVSLVEIGCAQTVVVEGGPDLDAVVDARHRQIAVAQQQKANPAPTVHGVPPKQQHIIIAHHIRPQLRYRVGAVLPEQHALIPRVRVVGLLRAVQVTPDIASSKSP